MSGKPIGVSLVCPGPIRTNMINTARGEPGTPEAGAIEMLKALMKGAPETSLVHVPPPPRASSDGHFKPDPVPAGVTAS